jgi:hypothetical protein
VLESFGGGSLAADQTSRQVSTRGCNCHGSMEPRYRHGTRAAIAVLLVHAVLDVLCHALGWCVGRLIGHVLRSSSNNIDWMSACLQDTAPNAGLTARLQSVRMRHPGHPRLSITLTIQACTADQPCSSRVTTALPTYQSQTKPPFTNDSSAHHVVAMSAKENLQVLLPRYGWLATPTMALLLLPSLC